MTLKQCYYVLALLICLMIATRCIKEANANTLELGQSIFTVHLWDRSERFEHRIDSQGIVLTNPMGYLRYNNISIIKGRDSVNSKFYGIMYFIPLYYGELILGGYSHNVKEWDKARINNGFAIKGNSWGVIPIIGFNAPFIIYEWKEENIKIKMNNIITPATFNSFISIQKEF